MLSMRMMFNMRMMNMTMMKMMTVMLNMTMMDRAGVMGGSLGSRLAAKLLPGRSSFFFFLFFIFLGKVVFNFLGANLFSLIFSRGFLHLCSNGQHHSLFFVGQSFSLFILGKVFLFWQTVSLFFLEKNATRQQTATFFSFPCFPQIFLFLAFLIFCVFSS